MAQWHVPLALDDTVLGHVEQAKLNAQLLQLAADVHLYR